MPVAPLLLALDLLPVRAHAAGASPPPPRRTRAGAGARASRGSPRAHRSRSPAPRSSSSSARKYTWKSRSPSSSSELRVVAARAPRRRPRRPPRPCAARSCARSARGPTGSRGAGARSAPAARAAPRRGQARSRGQPVVVRRSWSSAARSRPGTSILPSKSFFSLFDPLRHRVVLLLLQQLLLDRRLDLLERRRLRGLDRPSALMMCQPNCVLTGCETRPSRAGTRSCRTGATVWPFEIVSLPPCASSPDPASTSSRAARSSRRP